ncbi:thermonuclease family protein [Chloroflexus sp.]|uniref:thermonuclease family protein n=1 Tax=Chloroflexus sp. TaxID=1904827 RepID=UPI003C732E47
MRRITHFILATLGVVGGIILFASVLLLLDNLLFGSAATQNQIAAAPSPIVTTEPTQVPVTPSATPKRPTITPTPLPPTPTASSIPLPSPTAAAPPIAVACLADLSWEPATLVRVIDGDTIDIRINGREERVRYIGVDTPERGQPWYDEATQANRRLVEQEPLLVARDVSERDRYGRLLRYVFAGDQFVNLVLVEQGFAQVATFPPDVRCAETYLAAQQRARAEGVGLWGTTAAPASRPTAAPATGQQCHPAYPTVCIPPPPPDLDCSDIPYRRFQVDRTYGDPHRFDGDRDGIGCER